MSNATTLIIAIAVGILSSAARLPAQSVVTDSAQAAQRCLSATQLIKRGGTPAERADALRVLPMCGASASRLVITLLQQRRGDAANSTALEELASVAMIFRDADVFSTALSIAGDRAAGIAARVQSIRIAYFQLNPGSSDTYASFVTDQGPTYPTDADAPATVGTPLPSNAAAAAATVAATIVSDPTAPAPVRMAARWITR